VIADKPSELMIVIFSLAAGTYKLEIMTQKPRSALFDKVLTVL
jgi:hypothetical protein